MTKRAVIGVATAVMAAILVVLGLWLMTSCSSPQKLTVGFIYDNDVETPYSRNFRLAQKAVEHKFKEQVNVMVFSNVLDDELDAPMAELAANGATLVFTNNYGNMREQAARYPDIEVCQVSNDPYPDDEALPNYHTFKGEVYQARYASGIVAGLKLSQLIESGDISRDDARVGFVAAFPYAEVISGYSAFLLGVRSVIEDATMQVLYTYSWDNYVLEKDCATLLLDNGCVVISQHTDTVGPAVACEEYYAHPAFHIGYNEGMTDVAPNTSLTSARICWEPYVTGAVRACLQGRQIEDVVNGTVHPKNDMSAGYDNGWVELVDVNESLLPSDVGQVLDEAVSGMRDGSNLVFQGDYIGVNPDDPADVCDLSHGFHENEDSSIPSFSYVLRDVVTVLQDEEVGVYAQ